MAKIRKPISIATYLVILVVIIGFFKETLFISPQIFSWAGIIVATTCIVLIFLNKYRWAVILSCIAATGSFLFQGFTAICIPCTVIACLFIIQVFILEGIAWILCIALASGILMLLAANEPVPDKTFLYMSAHCKSCKPVVQELIKRDPQGLTWEPVAIQPSTEYLRDMGYQGKINQGVPPGKLIPVLEVGSKTISGDKKILKYLN